MMVCLPRDSSVFYSHLSPNSLVILAAIEKSKQERFKSAPKERELNRMSALGRKIYSKSFLQMQIANQQVMLAKYDFSYLGRLSNFTNKLPEDSKEEFKAFLAEGHLVTKTSLQSTLDVADGSSRTMASAVIMERVS